MRSPLNIQTRLINKYRGPVLSALRSQVQLTIEEIQSHGVQYALNEAKRHFRINDQIGSVIQSIYRESAEIAYKGLKIKSILSFIKSILDYFAKYIFEIAIIPISQTTTEWIRETIERVLAENPNAEQEDVIRALKDDKMLQARARMIARTEATRATNYASLKAADDQEYVVMKTWNSQEDDKVRTYRQTHGLADHTHVGVAGEKRPLNERFTNGLLYPGDPEGILQQTINCRCFMTFAYKLDRRGNKIPRERNILQTV